MNEHTIDHPLGVAHLVLSLDLGGLERVVLELVREARESGRRADVVCLDRPGLLAPRVEDLGGRVRCIARRPGERLGTIGRLKAALRELRPDVVHSHQIGALLYGGPAARAAGVPLTVHTEHGKHYSGRLRTRLVGRLAGRFAARFFCVSADIAAEALSSRIVPRRKVHVIPNGIETSRFLGGDDGGSLRRSLAIPPDVPVIGTVGRLGEIKRQDLLIRAFGRVRSRKPDVHLLLVGDGPLREELGELATALGLDGSVHFAGYQPEPERYLRVMDVFALTSRSEGMPLAVLEAWATGIPVVATRVGGLPELIEEGRTGVLIEPDDEAGLAEALCDLVLDRDRARQLGEAGSRQVRSRFDSRVMASGYNLHYADLLARDGVLS